MMSGVKKRWCRAKRWGGLAPSQFPLPAEMAGTTTKKDTSTGVEGANLADGNGRKGRNTIENKESASHRWRQFGVPTEKGSRDAENVYTIL